MKVIIISEVEARALLDQLELRKMRDSNVTSLDPEDPRVSDMHRAFHYVVCRWLQEMGADVVHK